MEKTYSSQQIFELIMNETSDMLFICDRDRHVIFATPNFYELTGYSPEELRNIDIFEAGGLHPDDKEYMRQRHNNLLLTGQSNSTESRFITKDGELRYMECKTTPLPDTKDYLQVVSLRDITERKKMELELERRKNRYEVLQRSLKSFSQDLFSVMKLSDLRERLLSEVKMILPDSDPDLYLFNPKSDGREINEIESYISNISTGKIESINDKMHMKIGERKGLFYILIIESAAIQEKMESIWLETLLFYTVMVFENLNVIENLMTQLETAVQSKETPQWVLRLLFNLQEQQRMTLSSDLHDTVLQDLIDLYRRLESLLNRYEITKESKRKLKNIEEGILDVIHQIRVTCNELRPPMLRELGLERALENLFDYIQLRSMFKIIFTSNMKSIATLSEEQTIGIYRTVQELINNAEKHSKACTLTFYIGCEEDLLKMVYTDDGIGFDVNNINPTFNSMGLTSMAQRAQSLGGKIEFISQTGSGLKAEMELPINNERSIV